MARNKVIGVQEAVETVLSGDTVATGVFVGIGFPEHLAAALERRFLTSGEPTGLTLVFAAGQGDGKRRGLNHFGHPAPCGVPELCTRPLTSGDRHPGAVR